MGKRIDELIKENNNDIQASLSYLELFFGNNEISKWWYDFLLNGTYDFDLTDEDKFTEKENNLISMHCKDCQKLAELNRELEDLLAIEKLVGAYKVVLKHIQGILK